MIVLFNPLSTTPGKQPLPLSLLSLAAVLGDAEPWRLVDGNLEPDPHGAIAGQGDLSRAGDLALLAVTVMPGPQLKQAVDVCRRVRQTHPHIRIVWGGYFPTQHADTVLRADYVDYVVRSQGEVPLRQLTEALRRGTPLAEVPGLSWRREDGSVVHNATAAMVALDELPDLPYDRLPMERYLHRTYLGERTAAHNSSFGCPFSCSFCAVVAMTNRRWLAQSPARVERVIRHLVDRYRIDSVQMHDMDFFISEARAAECAERLTPLGITWWALGRIDTLMQYSDKTWTALEKSGLKMVFSGAESASEQVLKMMNKGGHASPSLTLAMAERTRRHGIVPEFSFVIGTPPDPLGDLARTFEFIRRLKTVNPATEIILYTYTPVPMDGSLYSEASRLGFRFPQTLDEWASDKWQQTSLRRGDGIPWMDATVKRRVRNFERVLNAFYPTTTDRKLTGARRALLRTVSAWRYALRVYAAPYELRALQRLFHYQRPETTGF
jgi:anaerobic magnesium-protoporphyrin IX monomethyl ester cyclase